MHLQLAAALDEPEPEMRGAEIGLEAVLLEEHPLQRLGAVEPIDRREIGAAGEIPQNGAGFRKEPAGRRFEQRHVSARVPHQEIRGAGFTLEDIDLDQRYGVPSCASASRTL